MRNIRAAFLFLVTVLLSACTDCGSGPTTELVGDLALDTSGALWTAGNRGAVRWDIQPDTPTQYTVWRGLKSKQARAVAVAPDGAVWVGTAGDGVTRLVGKTRTTYTTADGLAGDWVYNIAAGPDGALWFSTAAAKPESRGDLVGRGVSRLDGGVWTTYTEADGLADDWVNAITVAADGAVWFGTGQGASRFDGESWTTYRKADGLAGDTVYAIAAAPDGALWFATNSSLSRFDGQTWTSYADPSQREGHWVRAIAVGPDGSAWFGLGGGSWGENSNRPECFVPHGASQFDGREWRTFSTAGGPADTWVHDVAVAPDGAIWFGTDAGLSRYDEKTWTTYETAGH